MCSPFESLEDLYKYTEWRDYTAYFSNIQQIFTEHLLGVKHRTWSEDKAVSETNMVAPAMELSMGHVGWSRTSKQTSMV